MENLWLVIYITVAVLVVAVFPFAIFYYEAQEENKTLVPFPLLVFPLFGSCVLMRLGDGGGLCCRPFSPKPPKHTLLSPNNPLTAAAATKFARDWCTHPSLSPPLAWRWPLATPRAVPRKFPTNASHLQPSVPVLLWLFHLHAHAQSLSLSRCCFLFVPAALSICVCCFLALLLFPVFVCASFSLVTVVGLAMVSLPHPHQDDIPCDCDVGAECLEPGNQRIWPNLPHPSVRVCLHHCHDRLLG